MGNTDGLQIPGAMNSEPQRLSLHFFGYCERRRLRNVKWPDNSDYGERILR